MDDLIARIVARLERNAADLEDEVGSGPVESMTPQGNYLLGQAGALRDAAAIVKDMAADEQARITEEDRYDNAD